ncbi:MAG: succinate dehydrogenase/fumarate reductase iron-sulfur subunit [Spirochaetota bacterium]
MEQVRRRLSIRRTDGSRDTFDVEGGTYTTLLDSLERIRARDDRSLLYRHSCHHGSCGTCGMIADGERVLACTTRLSDLPGEATIDPLTPFPVVGDLAIDPAPIYRDFPDEASYLRESGANPEAELPQELETDGRGFTRFENCIECGLCVSACPVQQRFMGPAALAAYGRELEKHPEREAELLPQIDRDEGVWGCDRALKCSQVCPLGVYPAKHIAVLQRKIDKNTSE